MVYLDRLIRDMDRKIEKNRERAAAESRPKPLRPDDIRKLDDIKARMNGGLRGGVGVGEAEADRGWRLQGPAGRSGRHRAAASQH